MRWYNAVLGVGFLAAVGSSPVGAADRKADAKADATVVAKLPTLAKGKYKGKHAVYRTPTFEAVMDETSAIWIQPLDDNGKKIGNPFVCYHVEPYYVPEGGQQRSRNIASFTNPPEPSEQPQKIHLEGTLADEVPFVVEYEFRANTITATGGCVDVPGLEAPTNFRLLCRFAPSHDIKPEVEQDDRIKLMKDCVLITREVDVEGRRKTYKYPYYDTMRFTGNMEEAQLKGLYGERMIEFKPAPNPEGRLCGYIYSDLCPWQGYVVQYITQGAKLNLRRNRAVMTVFERGGAPGRSR
jgi:hypothetical protein